MPKLKNKKALLKRMKITKSGKALAGKPGRRHLMRSKSANRRRHLRTKSLMSSAYKKTLNLATPYA